MQLKLLLIIILIRVPPPIRADPSEILALATEYIHGRRVVIFMETLNFYRAYILCQSRGLQLITVQDQRDYLDIRSFTTNFGVSDYWAGASCFGSSSWYWMDDASSVGSGLWFNGFVPDSRYMCVRLGGGGLRPGFDCQQSVSFSVVCEARRPDPCVEAKGHLGQNMTFQLCGKLQKCNF